jgi:hypothetical protein
LPKDSNSPNPFDYPLVVVEWDDAWVRAEEPVSPADVTASHKPTIVRTIGWLLREDATGVSLANEYYEDLYRGRSFIPAIMVRSVSRYRLTKPRKPKPEPVSQP